MHVDAGTIEVGGAETIPNQVQLTGTGHYSLVRPHVSEQSSAKLGTTFGYSCAIPVGSCRLDAKIQVLHELPVFVTKGDGSLSASQLWNGMKLDTGRGGIDGYDIGPGGATAHTGDGDINFDFESAPNDVSLSTDAGNITITLPKTAVGYQVTAHSDDGPVSNVVLGNPSSPCYITATTGSGTVTIRYRQPDPTQLPSPVTG